MIPVMCRRRVKQVFAASHTAISNWRAVVWGTRFGIITCMTGSPGQRRFPTGWQTGGGTRSHCRSAPLTSSSTSTATGMSLLLIFRDLSWKSSHWEVGEIKPLAGKQNPRDPHCNLTMPNGPLGMVECPTVMPWENSSLRWNSILWSGTNVQKVDCRLGNIKCPSVYSRHRLKFHGAVVTVNYDILLLSSFHSEANQSAYLRTSPSNLCYWSG